jgi:hypothetical protein
VEQEGWGWVRWGGGLGRVGGRGRGGGMGGVERGGVGSEEGGYVHGEGRR